MAGHMRKATGSHNSTRCRLTIRLPVRQHPEAAFRCEQITESSRNFGKLNICNKNRLLQHDH